MLENLRLLDDTDDVAARYTIARLASSRKLPLFLAVERGSERPARDVVTFHGYKRIKRSLNTVENTADQARSELDGKRCAP